MRFLTACFAALLLAGCNTLNQDISSADGTYVGIGGKVNPDSTFEGSIGYGNFAIQFVPAINSNQQAITFTGKCGIQTSLSAIIVTNTGATGGVSAGGVNNAFSAGAVVATGAAAESISHAQEIQSWRGVTATAAQTNNAAGLPGGGLPSSPHDQQGQNGLTACAH